MSFKRRYVREFLAETLGTFALVLFGDGAVAQVAVKLKGWGPIAKLLPLVNSFLLSTNEKPLFFP